MSGAADLRARLQDLHARTAETPLFNPVVQLGLELSRTLESGRETLAGLEQTVADLECEALQSRAARLHRLLAPVDLAANQAAFRAVVEASAASGDFAAFKARWAKPLAHIVFTGHPTFLLSRAQSDAVAAAASSGDVTQNSVCIVNAARDAITLVSEHDDALFALAQAQDARDRLASIVLDVAAAHWPRLWQDVRPVPFRLASWVGYDMDGRTDIGWQTSIHFRLMEKAMRLARYADGLNELLDTSRRHAELGSASMPRSSAMGSETETPSNAEAWTLKQVQGDGEGALAMLRAALSHTQEMVALFATDLSDPAALSDAANRMTADAPGKLLSLAPVIALLEEAAKSADLSQARALLTLAAAMRADGLGMGWIHFRVNASQLHNAIRRRIDPDNRLDLASRTALKRMRKLLDDVKPLRSNFAALAIENTTALRQFLAMAQILHHVDADAPIRMLIAECEDPQTVLAALYFAKLFGIEDRVDVSPLFETESALEHGGRFLEALLGEPAYQSYARTRGRVSIQTGFSDAGRFVGQLPAALAIERLQGRLASAMAAQGLSGVAALIFNTHGESMGRGAHPASMADRMSWSLSPWARGRFAAKGIPLEPEVSYQGGDGYLFFRTPELALATLTRVAEAESRMPDGADDPFYARTDLSLDFYRGIRRVQRAFLESRTYARSITAFGLGLLNETGSRKSRRQSDLAADREMSLRQIRAIPHNAILQQLGYPVNLIAGAGTAAVEDVEGIAELINASARGQQIMRMLRAADRLASIKSVAAYGELFNSAYWASRPYRGMEQHLEAACLALADKLTTDDRNSAFRTLTSRLRVDAVKLHRLLERIDPEVESAGREDVRRSLGALQALRLALMQHMFLLAVQIPAFSRSNDISRDDVIEMVFTLRIDDALAQLRRAYPVSFPSITDFSVAEPSDYPDDAATGYAEIHARFIDPIEQAHGLSLRIGAAIANHFGAHG
jgi:phosphoenolpyruvate carboxylase